MKKILKYISLAVLVLFVGALIFRMCYMDSKTVLNKITVTDNVRAAYEKGGRILTHSPYEDISYDGYMKCYAMVYLPEYGEFQVTVKSNKSAYEKLGTTEDSGFDFALFNDTTEQEYAEYTFTRDSEGRYGYYRLVFNGVELSEDGELSLVMMPHGSRSKYSAISLHKVSQEFKDYKLSKEEIALIGDR